MIPITSGLCNNTVCPSGNTDTHRKKKELQEKKPRYSDKFLVASTLTPPRQHQKSNISKNNASKKGTMH
jgi:hypothetical protein